MLKPWAIATGGFALVAACYQPTRLDSHTLLQQMRSEELAATAARTLPSAANSARAGQAISVDEAVALALCLNPDLRALRNEREAAEGDVIAARALSNPTVDLQRLHVQRMAGQAWAVELGWSPPQVGVYSARGAVAEESRNAAQADVAESELNIATEVRAAHAALLSLAEQSTLLEQALEIRRKLVELVQKRAAGGASTKVDVSLAQLALSRVERERDDLAAREIASKLKLAALLGVSEPVSAAGELPPRAPIPFDVGQLEELAVRNRPAVQSASARYSQREQGLLLEHSRRWPNLKMVGRYRQNETKDDPHDFMVGLQLSLPLLDQNRGNIRTAEAIRDRERERYRAVLAEIRRDIGAAHEELALRDATLKRFDDAVLPSLTEHEKLLSTAMAGGQLDVVALTTAQEVILRTRREHAELRLAFHRARLALERATGQRITIPQEGLQ